MFDISTPSALTTTLRQIANSFGGVLVGMGLATESQFQIWSGLAISAAVAGYAIYKQIRMRSA